jgi:hypothetical protein
MDTSDLNAAELRGLKPGLGGIVEIRSTIVRCVREPSLKYPRVFMYKRPSTKSRAYFSSSQSFT